MVVSVQLSTHKKLSSFVAARTVLMLGCEEFMSDNR